MEAAEEDAPAAAEAAAVVVAAAARCCGCSGCGKSQSCLFAKISDLVAKSFNFVVG
jgi:hypothetical protein